MKNISEIIEVAIGINEAIGAFIEIETTSTDEELVEVARDQIDYLQQHKFNLWKSVDEFFGINEDDFAGDMYIEFINDCLSGKYTSHEVIEQKILYLGEDQGYFGKLNSRRVYRFADVLKVLDNGQTAIRVSSDDSGEKTDRFVEILKEENGRLRFTDRVTGEYEYIVSISNNLVNSLWVIE